MKFQIYHEGEPWDGTKGYRWRLRAANGKIVADSGEAYSSEGNCRKAVNRLEDMLHFALHWPTIEVLDDH